MESLNIDIDDESVSVVLTVEFKKEILQNAKYFKCESMCEAVKRLFIEDIYDVTSFYTHSDGKKYGIVHTLSGLGNPAELFQNKLGAHEWKVCASDFKYKKECVKQYLESAECETSKVYCLFEEYS